MIMKLTLLNFGSLINCRNVTLMDLLNAKVSCFIPHRRDTEKFLEKLTFKLLSKYFQHENTENRKNIEQKYVSTGYTLYPHGIKERL